MEWLCLLIGFAAGGAICGAAAVWMSRRAWLGARRMAARTKGHDHLVELGQLAGGLAHEIKNPLSTINVNLQLLAEDLARQDDEDHRRLHRRLAHVQEEAGRLKAILDDFLNYAGRIELTAAPHDIRDLIEEIADFFAPQAEATHVVMRTVREGPPVMCNIDANLIKQAVLNLLINAIQAMPDGGELILRVGARRDKGNIEVIDTGLGLSPEARERIFDVYYSTKKHGTGLGLPTARRIIREHGGTLRVDSEPGRGTRFVISLPLIKT